MEKKGFCFNIFSDYLYFCCAMQTNPTFLWLWTVQCALGRLRIVWSLIVALIYVPNRLKCLLGSSRFFISLSTRMYTNYSTIIYIYILLSSVLCETKCLCLHLNPRKWYFHNKRNSSGVFNFKPQESIYLSILLSFIYLSMYLYIYIFYPGNFSSFDLLLFK